MPKLALRSCELIELQNISGSPKKRDFQKTSFTRKVIGRNLKLEKLRRSLFEKEFENISLFLMIFPGSLLAGSLEGACLMLAAPQTGAGSTALVFAAQGKNRGGFTRTDSTEGITPVGSYLGLRLGFFFFRLCRAILRQGLSFLGNSKIPRYCMKTLKITEILNTKQLSVSHWCRHSKRPYVAFWFKLRSYECIRTFSLSKGARDTTIQQPMPPAAAWEAGRAVCLGAGFGERFF